MHQELDLFKRLAEKLLQVEKEQPVAQYIPEGEVISKLDLDLQEEGIDDSHLEQLLTDIVKYTPKTSSSAFFNQLFGGRHPKATLGELLAVMLNNSMYTYKVGGPQVGIEKSVIDAVCESIGFGNQADGTFPPGGSMSNLMALIMARDAKADTRKHGVTQTMTMYTSKESHYSNIKNASFAGIGRERFAI